MTTTLRHTAIAAVVTLASAAASAQNPIVPQATGMVAGTVRDRESKQPLENVTVTIEGTAYGNLTKANGQYTIVGIPPGTYGLVVRRAGYATAEVENIVVRPDVKRVQDIEMSVSGTTYQPTGAPPRVEPVPPPTAAACGSVHLGITGVQGASMSVTQVDGTRQLFSFQSEPVVIEVPSWSGFRVGDIIQAVNGEPITTRAGAEAYSNPPAGVPMRVTARRNGERIEVNFIPCNVFRSSPPAAFPRDTVRFSQDTVRTTRLTGSSQVHPLRYSQDTARAIRNTGASQVPLAYSQDTLRSVRSSGVQTQSPAFRGRGGRGTAGGLTAMGGTLSPKPSRGDLLRDSVAQFVVIDDQGVALQCTTPCTRAITAEGNPYWRFGRPPTVTSAVRGRTEAMKDAGLEPGDYVTKVNGHLITSEQAGVLLTHASLMLPLQLEITRNGERKKATIRK